MTSNSQDAMMANANGSEHPLSASVHEDAKSVSAKSQKKEPKGADKKAAAKAEKVARRAAQKSDGTPTADPGPQAAGGKRAAQDQMKQSQQRKPLNSSQPALPQRTRRPSNTVTNTPVPKTSTPKARSQKMKQLPFLSHLYSSRRRPTAAQLQHPPSHRDIHPSIQALALHLAAYRICGSQARTIALLLALQAVIRNYTTPQGTSLPRHLSSEALSAQLNHVKTFGRPFCTAQSNAVRWLKNRIATLDPSIAETAAVNTILSAIDEFIREKFTIADRVIAQVIAGSSHSASITDGGEVEEGLLQDGDNVLVLGKSAVVCSSLRKGAARGKRFSVLCVDSGRPLWEGRSMSKSLATLKVPRDEKQDNHSDPLSAQKELRTSHRTKRSGGITSITYVPISHLHAHLLQSPVTKAFFAANSIYSNGSILGRTGQAQAALAVRTECPGAHIYVLAESIKCTERAVLGTNSLAAAELAPEDELVPAASEEIFLNEREMKDARQMPTETGKDSSGSQDIGGVLTGWEEKDNLFLMNLLHDITPPELIDAIVTEVGTVPPGTAAAVGRMVGVGGELGEV